jgi:hypothetical protein
VVSVVSAFVASARRASILSPSQGAEEQVDAADEGAATGHPPGVGGTIILLLASSESNARFWCNAADLQSRSAF